MRLRLAILLLVAGCTTEVSAGPAGGMSTGPAPLARLDVVDRGDGPEAWAENLIAGPVEVMLSARGATPSAQPPLPARATVPARGRVLVSRVERADAELLLEVVPGHPGARPRDVEYAWPLDTRMLHVAQGWGGGFSHRDAENRHAVDFAVPEGTPVLAAREGVVMQAEAGFAHGGLDSPEGVDRANFVRILHEDGTMAVYAHLAPGGVHVRQGERVRRGQRIGSSGSTGYSGGPHLHFAVQANRGRRLASLPFRMFGPTGVLRFAEAPVDAARP
ncbi:M23 family metallopeptidase [Luteimonas granuli]|uniref:M23 family metallopeptidase n=1 Tax=Luteimonas granuli TaxID=1176533 RepID=A0A518N2Y6_9GAMM|nr:M23 family metallopeptidase [Luteimonas granuli]QDW66254.1 M23 family metallopeptidase [Luteimonas granuli]